MKRWLLLATIVCAACGGKKNKDKATASSSASAKSALPPPALDCAGLLGAEILSGTCEMEPTLAALETKGVCGIGGEDDGQTITLVAKAYADATAAKEKSGERGAAIRTRSLVDQDGLYTEWADIRIDRVVVTLTAKAPNEQEAKCATERFSALAWAVRDNLIKQMPKATAPKTTP